MGKSLKSGALLAGIVLGVCWSSTLAAASTRTAASPSLVDVSAAVASATNGDTVQIPAGTVTWNGGITINKTITLSFAGTIINGSIPISTYIFEVRAPSTGVRITGLTIDDHGNGGGVRILGATGGTGGAAIPNNRIDHCTFKNCGYTTNSSNYSRGVQFRGYKVYGVIDHCTFINCTTSFEVLGDDCASWNDPIGLGTVDCVTIEDNHFVRDTSTISFSDVVAYNSNGARTLFRHNAVDSPNPNAGEFWDSHGNNNLTSCPSGARGTIYTVLTDNILNLGHPNYGGKMVYIRGGMLIAGNNTVTTDGTGYLWNITEEECWYASAGGSNFGPDHSDYPREDQITNTYVWGNTLNGVSHNSVGLFDNGIGHQYVAGVIQSGRDYFPGVTPPAWTGSPSLTQAPWAQGMATGTISGNTRLYPGNVGYTPLVYPHPLVSGGPPSSPTPTPTATPNPTATPSPTPTPGPVGTVFTADEGDITSPFTVSSNATVSQAVETLNPTAGGRAAYTFNVPISGDYALSAQVQCPNDYSNSFFVNIDAEPSATMVWAIPVTSGTEVRTATWGNDPAAKVWTLQTGTHQLIIRGREANAVLVQIALSIPPSPPQGVGIVTH